MNPSLEVRSVLILGAGLTGLSAAYHLEQAGSTDYVLLERDERVGGLARTETYAGFSFDHAIHVLYTHSSHAADLICNKLLRGNVRKEARQSYCYSAGRYTEYPYQANNFGLPIDIIVENLAGLLEAHFARPHNGPPLHFEAWIYQTFGRGIADHFMIPYNRRQWAWDLRDMDYDWIADRVPMPELQEVIRGALARSQQRYGSNREFWYPVSGGIEALSRAFLPYIPEGRLRCGANVVRIDAGRREVTLTDGRCFRYDRLLSTIPLPALVGALGDAVPADVMECASGLKNNAVHTVNLGLDGRDLEIRESAHWVYFSDESAIFHRLSFPHHFSASMAPPDCASIQAEISESPYRRHHRGTLVQETLAGLVRVGILSHREARPVSEGGRVRVAQVLTLNPAYVIYNLAHRTNTRRIKKYLRSLGIDVRGRFGEWEYLNMDRAILSGEEAAMVIGHAR